MLINAIEGATRRIGKAQGYLGLPVRDFLFPEGMSEGTPAMKTSWQPTPQEINAIVQGAPIYLTLLGTAHPPVLLEVGKIPK